MLTSSLWRTTTFRLTVLFGASFAIAIVLLLGLVYFQTASYLTDRVDRALRAEAVIFRQGGPERMLQRFQREATRDPLNSFGFFSYSGERIAGDTRLSPAQLPADGQPRDLPSGAPGSPARALEERMPWGEILIVERDTRQLVALRKIIFDALFWSGALIIILGLAAGVLLSIRPLRRIRVMQTASELIAAGDFSMRLPLDNSGDELDELAQITNRMMDEAERLMIQARTVGEGVAHELRTPLTRLRAMLDHACQNLEPSDPRLALLDQCVVETDGVLARFRALLRIAALEARGRQVGIDAVSLQTVIDQIAELYQPLAAEKDIRLETCVEARDIVVGADAELLMEALSNLIDNALKFTPAGGRVRVVASIGSDGPRLEVIDDGPGIPAAERRLVTKRFYRGARNAKVEGFGLGLSMVAAIAELHDFDLSFHDASPGTIARLVCRAPQTR